MQTVEAAELHNQISFAELTTIVVSAAAADHHTLEQHSSERSLAIGMRRPTILRWAIRWLPILMLSACALVCVGFFASLLWYLQPHSRETVVSTSVAYRVVAVLEPNEQLFRRSAASFEADLTVSSSWSKLKGVLLTVCVILPSPVSTWCLSFIGNHRGPPLPAVTKQEPQQRYQPPHGYQVLHLRCQFADPADTADQQHFIRHGRIPVVFIHGNAGTYGLGSGIASLLPLGKWPSASLSGRRYQQSHLPALGMTLFSIDLNEEANIQCGGLMVQQARFVYQSVLSLKKRFVAYYGSRDPPKLDGGADDELTAACNSSSSSRVCRFTTSTCQTAPYERARVDFLRQGAFESEESTADKNEGFCAAASDEFEAVRRHGIWLIGHSMGGIVAKLAGVIAALVSPMQQQRLIAGIITLNSPHRYPPIFLDSVMWRLYRAHHRLAMTSAAFPSDSQPSCMVARNEDDTLVDEWHGLLGMHRGTANRVDESDPILRRVRAQLPPVASIHGGALDEQVFFETAAVTSTKSAASCGAHPADRTIASHDLLDCGLQFDHNALLWSVEFVEPLVEAIWAAHSRIVDAQRRLTNRSEEDGNGICHRALHTSLLTATDHRRSSSLNRHRRQLDSGNVTDEQPTQASLPVVTMRSIAEHTGNSDASAAGLLVIFFPARASELTAPVTLVWDDGTDEAVVGSASYYQIPLPQITPYGLRSWSIVTAKQKRAATVRDVTHVRLAATDVTAGMVASLGVHHHQRAYATDVSRGALFLNVSRGASFQLWLEHQEPLNATVNSSIRGNGSPRRGLCVWFHRQRDGDEHRDEWRPFFSAHIPMMTISSRDSGAGDASSGPPFTWRAYQTEPIFITCRTPGGPQLHVAPHPNVIFRTLVRIVTDEVGPTMVWCGCLWVSLAVMVDVIVGHVTPAESARTQRRMLFAFVTVCAFCCSMWQSHSMEQIATMSVSRWIAAASGCGIGLVLHAVAGLLFRLLQLGSAPPLPVTSTTVKRLRLVTAVVVFVVVPVWLWPAVAALSFVAATLTAPSHDDPLVLSCRVGVLLSILSFVTTGSFLHLKNSLSGAMAPMPIQVLAVEHVTVHGLVCLHALLVLARMSASSSSPHHGPSSNSATAGDVFLHGVVCYLSIIEVATVNLNPSGDCTASHGNEYRPTSALVAIPILADVFLRLI